MKHKFFKIRSELVLGMDMHQYEKDSQWVQVVRIRTWTQFKHVSGGVLGLYRVFFFLP